ncbi:hypothetical protein ANANG_G00004380 [Anguilla anguilla]|uniref:Uncharacterized protein n=1 Tax=Anguilla anguilla TaxID=7936 RepID=A0A9D3MXP7_ANGAN|nr:hypothetical protein ANANG_G00004380 [Anguilla anguilla]
MSCLDVMCPPYGRCAPYDTAASAFSFNSLQAPVGLRSSSPCAKVSGETGRMQKGAEGVSGAAGAGAPYPQAGRRAEDGPKEKQDAPEAEYLNSRCVLFTYYRGDIGAVVDEHFSRALSARVEGEGKRQGPNPPTDAPSPSSRRSFPLPSGTVTTPPLQAGALRRACPSLFHGPLPLCPAPGPVPASPTPLRILGVPPGPGLRAPEAPARTLRPCRPGPSLRAPAHARRQARPPVRNPRPL